METKMLRGLPGNGSGKEAFGRSCLDLSIRYLLIVTCLPMCNKTFFLLVHSSASSTECFRSTLLRATSGELEEQASQCKLVIENRGRGWAWC